MTKDQAAIIQTISPLQWQTIVELIEDDRTVTGKMLDDPGSSRDLDQYNKGGRAFGLQVIEYWENAHKILNPKKEGEGK